MAYFIAFQKLDIMRVMMSNLQQYLIEKLRVHDIIELCNGWCRYRMDIEFDDPDLVLADKLNMQSFCPPPAKTH